MFFSQQEENYKKILKNQQDCYPFKLFAEKKV